MKKIQMGKGEEVSTPWLTSDEAALYCNMSRTSFNKICKGIPRSEGGKPKYHTKVLDGFMSGEEDLSAIDISGD